MPFLVTLHSGQDVFLVHLISLRPARSIKKDHLPHDFVVWLCTKVVDHSVEMDGVSEGRLLVVARASIHLVELALIHVTLECLLAGSGAATLSNSSHGGHLLEHINNTLLVVYSHNMGAVGVAIPEVGAVAHQSDGGSITTWTSVLCNLMEGHVPLLEILQRAHLLLNKLSGFDAATRDCGVVGTLHV